MDKPAIISPLCQAEDRRKKQTDGIILPGNIKRPQETVEIPLGSTILIILLITLLILTITHLTGHTGIASLWTVSLAALAALCVIFWNMVYIRTYRRKSQTYGIILLGNITLLILANNYHTACLSALLDILALPACALCTVSALSTLCYIISYYIILDIGLFPAFTSTFRSDCCVALCMELCMYAFHVMGGGHVIDWYQVNFGVMDGFMDSLLIQLNISSFIVNVCELTFTKKMKKDSTRIVKRENAKEDLFCDHDIGLSMKSLRYMIFISNIVFATLGVMTSTPWYRITIFLTTIVGNFPYIIFQLALKTTYLLQRFGILPRGAKSMGEKNNTGHKTEETGQEEKYIPFSSFPMVIILITLICNIAVLGAMVDTPWLTLLVTSGIVAGVFILPHVILPLVWTSTLLQRLGIALMFSGEDVKITSRISTEIRMRYFTSLPKIESLQIQDILECSDDLYISETSSVEPNDDIDDLYIFKSHIASLDEPLMLADVKITSNYSTEVTIRYCPPDEYNNFSESVKLEEGLCISTPIIQIDNFERFQSNSCKELKIRHNVYEWQNFKMCHLRAYRDLKDLNSYLEIEATMCKDYITVRGHSNDGQTEERNDKRFSSDLTSRQQTEQNRSGNSSNDEGYARRDESPTPTTYSLLHLCKAEDICNIRLYFTRFMKNNTCPLPHQITVFAVLDKPLKINEFIEKELRECGREQAAERIRVAIFKDQTYTPILGESPKINPEIVWDENNPFGKFSYDLLNQKNGFSRLEKKLPPLLLYCDERKYFMMKLNVMSKEKPPEDHIYSQGAGIYSLICEKFCDNHSNPTLPSQTSGTLSNPVDNMNMMACCASGSSSLPNITSSLPASTTLSNTIYTMSTVAGDFTGFSSIPSPPASGSLSNPADTMDMVTGFAPSVSTFPIPTTGWSTSASLSNTGDTMRMVVGDVSGSSSLPILTSSPSASAPNPVDTISTVTGVAPNCSSFSITTMSLPTSVCLSNTFDAKERVDGVPWSFSSSPISTENLPEINTFQISAVDPSSIQPPRKSAKGSLRRCRDEIEQGSGGLKCPYCSKILTRQQTLRDHTKKFHPSADLTSLNGKGKGKGKKNSASSTFLNESSSMSINQQVLGLLPFDTSFGNNAQGLPGAQDIQTDIEMETESTEGEERGSTNGMLGDLPNQLTTNTNAAQRSASLGSSISGEMPGQFLMPGGNASSNTHFYGDATAHGADSYADIYDMLNNN